MDLIYLQSFAETVCFYVYNVYSRCIRCILKNPSHDLIDNSETGNKRRHWKLDDACSKRRPVDPGILKINLSDEWELTGFF